MTASPGLAVGYDVIGYVVGGGLLTAGAFFVSRFWNRRAIEVTLRGTTLYIPPSVMGRERVSFTGSYHLHKVLIKNVGRIALQPAMFAGPITIKLHGKIYSVRLAGPAEAGPPHALEGDVISIPPRLFNKEESLLVTILGETIGRPEVIVRLSDGKVSSRTIWSTRHLASGGEVIIAFVAALGASVIALAAPGIGIFLGTFAGMILGGAAASWVTRSDID